MYDSLVYYLIHFIHSSVATNFRQQVLPSSTYLRQGPKAHTDGHFSNIERSDWVRLATEIEMNYALFDAFIVLHGTVRSFGIYLTAPQITFGSRQDTIW